MDIMYKLAKFTYFTTVFKDEDIYVHDSRSTEESVASYSYSACVGSIA